MSDDRIDVGSMVSHRDKKGYVEIRWGTQHAQLPLCDVRELAMRFVGRGRSKAMPESNDLSEYVDLTGNTISNRPLHVFDDLFRKQETAAEVPAIRLTRAEWEAIRTVIKELGDLVDDLCPNAIETALIEGKAISGAAQAAWGLKHLWQM